MTLFNQLPAPKALRALPACPPSVGLKLNAHVHLPPNFSAFESVAQAVGLAAEQGLSILGASNYYDWSVYQNFAALARARGILPLFCLEIICLIPELQATGVKINF